MIAVTRIDSAIPAFTSSAGRQPSASFDHLLDSSQSVRLPSRTACGGGARWLSYELRSSRSDAGFIAELRFIASTRGGIDQLFVYGLCVTMRNFEPLPPGRLRCSIILDRLPRNEDSTCFPAGISPTTSAGRVTFIVASSLRDLGQQRVLGRIGLALEEQLVPVRIGEPGHPHPITYLRLGCIESTRAKLAI